MSYILFDIGGTNTRVALSEDLTSFKEVVKYKTEAKYKDGIKKLVETAKELAGDRKIEGAAGGVRGVLDQDNESIYRDELIPDWVGKPIVADLKKAFKCEVYIENDTAMVGLGEFHFGAGHDADIMVYHTVSTGVGGVKIEHGELDEATLGFEPGHQVLDIDRTVLGDDVEPTLENLISGTAIERRMGMKPYEIPQDDVIWDELAGYLAQGLKNTILYWSPEIIVLGGSMIVGDPRIELEPIRKHTNDAVAGIVPCPLIVDAKLGDEGGLYGAMVLLQQKLPHN